MNKTIITLSLMAASWSVATAAVVNDVQAGTLRGAVDSPATETTLTVTGTINANDLYFISEEMPALRTLDLSGCRIAACHIDKRRNGTLNFGEGVLPKSVFAGSRIESIILPAGQDVEIEEGAFAASGLKDISLGANVAAVGTGAFSNCDALESATVSGKKQTGSHVFANCPALKTVTVTGIDSIAPSMFANDKALTEVKGIADVVAIGANAFADCASLTSTTFGSRLSSIGAGAFSRSGLQSADMSECERLKSIGEWAFAHCAGLKSVALPAALTTLGRGILFDCDALGAVVLPESVVTVGDYALKGLTSVEDLTLPAALGHIGTLAMSGMDNLKSINAESLSAVPSLGEDVWDRLNKSEIELKVKLAQADEFAATPQWQDFNIVPDRTSGIADITAPADSKVTGRFEGNELVVRSEGDPLAQVNVYDLSGRYLTGCRADDETVRIDCSKYDGNVFIVEAYTASGMHAAVKLMRNTK